MKIASIFLILFLLQFSAFSQDFSRFFLDTAELQTANNLIVESNGSIWLGGTKLPANGNDLVAWLYRLDHEGNVTKRFQFPFSGSQTWVGMAKINTQNLGVILGQRMPSGITENWMAILDTSQLISFQKIEGADNAILDHCSADSYGNLLACGFIGVPGPSGNNVWIGKISAPGILRWNYENYISPNDHAAQTKEGPDGRLYVVGTVANQGYNPYVACLDTAGNLVWDLVLHTPWNDGGRALDFDSLGRIWLVGESSTSAGPEFDTELAIVNSQGQLEWQQWLGASGQEAAFDIQKATQSGFWVGGYSNASTGGIGPVSPFLMRLDAHGNSLGEAFWPQTAPSPVYDLWVDGDSVFYFCGLSNDRAYLFKRKNPQLSSVFVVSNSAKQSSQNRINIQVNRETGLIHFNSDDIEYYSVNLFDMFGKIVRTQQLNQGTIYVAGLSFGCYWLEGVTRMGEKKILGRLIWN